MNLQLSKIRKHYRRLFNQTSFRAELHVHFAVPEPFWKESFEENGIIIRNRGLSRRETFRKGDRTISPNSSFAHRVRTSNWLVLLDST